MRLRFIFFLFASTLFFLPTVSQAATLSLAPATAQVTVGQSITATIRVNAGGTAINAAEATVSFPSDLLKLTSVSKSGTIFKFWTVEPSGSNSSARIVFSGGLPSPGYNGTAGTILKVTWQALGPGTATIRVTGGKILANDGLGTNVLTGQSGATFTLTAANVPPPSPPTPAGPTIPTVSSSEYSSEQQWYTAAEATLSWTRPAGLEGVSYQLDRQKDTTPDETIDSTGSSTNVSIPEDGVWYFHLRGKFSSGWSGVRHFQLQRDTIPPEAFDVIVTRDRGLADPSPTITFTAKDQHSGIAGYSLSINGQPAIPVTSPHTLKTEQAGEYRVEVTATDGAGNTRESDATFSVEGYAVPVITFVSTPLILLENLKVRGTAQAGDRVNIFLDGELVGSTYAGAPNLAVTDGTTVRLPWNFTSKQSLSPGTHRLTATATSADGQTSLSTDPVSFVVRGAILQWRGRPLATFAALPIVGMLIAIMVSVIAAVMTKLWLVVRRLEHRETIVNQELQELQKAVHGRRVSDAAIEEAIQLIDEDLVGQRRRPAAKRPRRRSKKSS